MITLTTTERGQLTIRKEVLRHLGIEPGGKIELDLLPNGKVEMRAPKGKFSMAEVMDHFSRNTYPYASDEEIKEAIERGWAGER
jgi:antitoxin PrlF